MAKYNEETVASICQKLEEGLTQKDAALLSDIDESLFYIWYKEHNDSDKEYYKKPLSKLYGVGLRANSLHKTNYHLLKLYQS